MAAEQRVGRFDNAQALAQKINYSAEWYRKNAVAFERAEAPGPDWGNESLEIWSYDPGLSGTSESSWIRGEYATRGGIADRLSLYADPIRGISVEDILEALAQIYSL